MANTLGKLTIQVNECMAASSKRSPRTASGPRRGSACGAAEPAGAARASARSAGARPARAAVRRTARSRSRPAGRPAPPRRARSRPAPAGVPTSRPGRCHRLVGALVPGLVAGHRDVGHPGRLGHRRVVLLARGTRTCRRSSPAGPRPAPRSAPPVHESGPRVRAARRPWSTACAQAETAPGTPPWTRASASATRRSPGRRGSPWTNCASGNSRRQHARLCTYAGRLSPQRACRSGARTPGRRWPAPAPSVRGPATISACTSSASRPRSTKRSARPVGDPLGEPAPVGLEREVAELAPGL